MHPQSFLLVGWEAICMTSLSSARQSPFKKKSLFGCHSCSRLLPGFPLPPTLWQNQSLSQIWPVAVLLFSKLQVQLGSPQLSGTVPDSSDHHPGLGAQPAAYVLMHLLFLPQRLCTFKPLHSRVCTLLVFGSQTSFLIRFC